VLFLHAVVERTGLTLVAEDTAFLVDAVSRLIVLRMVKILLIIPAELTRNIITECFINRVETQNWRILDVKRPTPIALVMEVPTRLYIGAVPQHSCVLAMLCLIHFPKLVHFEV
jgi:hypothetical protein